MTPTDTNNVRLVELGDAPYHDYSKALVRDYAADKVRAGTWSQAEAEGRAARDVDGLLPEGPATQGHFLYSVRDDSTDADVGIVWFALRMDLRHHYQGELQAQRLRLPHAGARRGQGQRARRQKRRATRVRPQPRGAGTLREDGLHRNEPHHGQASRCRRRLNSS